MTLIGDYLERSSWLDSLSDYLIQDLFEILHQQSCDLDVVNLMCTCQRLNRLGQPKLTHRYQHLRQLPHTTTGYDMDTWRVRLEWRDSQGNLHREGDLPAVIYTNGTQKWYQHGQLHRKHDRPAIIDESKTRSPSLFWYQYGQPFREEDRPNVILSNGTQQWCKKDNDPNQDDHPYLQLHPPYLHRDQDQPAVIKPDGSKEWYQYGKLHRNDDRPAVISADGTLKWYQYGQLHRDKEQPAVIHADGSVEYLREGYPYRAEDLPDVT